MGIEHGILESYNSDFELQFSHPLKHIVGMCRIIHKPQAKTIGNGFLQLKSSGQASTSSIVVSSTSSSSGTSSSLTGNGLRHTLTASTSYGSLSSSAASAYHQQQQAAATAAAEASAEQAQNCMEFQGPITGLVYLLKDPKDPLLHIYLFECEAVEEVSSFQSQPEDGWEKLSTVLADIVSVVSLSCHLSSIISGQEYGTELY